MVRSKKNKEKWGMLRLAKIEASKMKKIKKNTKISEIQLEKEWSKSHNCSRVSDTFFIKSTRQKPSEA